MQHRTAMMLNVLVATLVLLTLTACTPKGLSARQNLAGPVLDDGQLAEIAQGLLIPPKDIPEYKPRVPPLLGPKDPNDCGPAGLCVNPDLDPMAYGADLGSDRKLAMLGTGCGPNAYCTEDERAKLIPEAYKNMELFLKAIIAHTCNVAICDEAWFASMNPLYISLYQKACSLGAPCEVHQIRINLCVAAKCNVPDAKPSDDGQTTEEPPEPGSCAEGDNECNRKRTEEYEMDRLEAEAARSEASESERKVVEKQQDVAEAKTPEEKEAAENELTLLMEKMDVAEAMYEFAIYEAGRARVVGGVGQGSGSASQGSDSGFNTLVTDAVKRLGQEKVLEILDLAEGQYAIHLSREWALYEQISKHENQGPKTPATSDPLGAASGTFTVPESLNQFAKIASRLPRLIKRAVSCGNDFNCVVTLASFQAAADFEVSEDTRLDPILLPLGFPINNGSGITLPKVTVPKVP